MHPARGARQLIDRHMELVEFVRMENAAFDLDRPEDLQRLNADRRRYSGYSSTDPSNGGPPETRE